MWMVELGLPAPVNIPSNPISREIREETYSNTEELQDQTETFISKLNTEQKACKKHNFPMPKDPRWLKNNKKSRTRPLLFEEGMWFVLGSPRSMSESAAGVGHCLAHYAPSQTHSKIHQLHQGEERENRVCRPAWSDHEADRTGDGA